MISAQRLLDELKQQGVTHIIGLPDNSSAALFSLLQKDSDIPLINVTREGEAFALAAGLWMGGGTPAVLIQNTGFLESGDAFRGTVSRMRIPLLCLITYRGYKKMKWMTGGSENRRLSISPDISSRSGIDSAAVVTEPTLLAWGMPHFFLGDDKDFSELGRAILEAQRLSHPVSLLITSGMI